MSPERPDTGEAVTDDDDPGPRLVDLEENERAEEG
ncbi:MAG: hypothetical protein QOD92_4387 [Acidimicrobiaceae bacterium]|jgi:hypothetical protein